LVPGGPNFELSYGSTAVLPYLLSLSGKNNSGDIVQLKRLANARIGEWEEKLMGALLEFLRSKKNKGVRILGLEEADSSKRAPTISFVIDGKSSKQVVESFDEQDVRFSSSQY
jgi:selenocysteine lyase/cysteine desulfurase